nr:undecaprenyl-phosphate glucose phosphotransferase [Methylobacterium sp. OTU13CASTA1]
MPAFDVRDLLEAAGQTDRQAAAPTTQPIGATEAQGRGNAGRGEPLSPVVLVDCVRAGEFLLILALGVAVRHLSATCLAPLSFRQFAAAFGVAVLAVGLFQAAGAYRIDAVRSLRTGLRLGLAWTATVLVVGTGLVLAEADDPCTRAWLANLFAFGLGLLLAERFAVARIIRTRMRRGRFDRRTAIVGGGPVAEDLIRALDAQAESGIRIVGVFDDRGDRRSDTVVAGYPKLGTVDDLVAYARTTRLDLVIFTIPITAEDRILQMLAKLWVLPIDIRLSAQASKLRLRPRAYSYLGTVPVLDVFDKPMADWDIIAKSVFDRLVGLAMLVALSPVMLGVALAVALTSPGPVLFRQKRYGFNNEAIEVYKFRSMYNDKADVAASRQVTRGDPRVTPVGRFIRRTSLDELPQLFNVIKGELSLVGPRPHALQGHVSNTLYDQVVDGYFARHKVKPGITGWAQVNGWRGETDTSDKIQRRVEHDLHYIENWSVLFDIKIMLATPMSLISTKNAY